jgi:hypothetical protein
MADHQMVLDYMSGLSNVLNKTVILTPENRPEIELISVTENIVTINF